MWKVKFYLLIRKGVTEVENFNGSVSQYKQLATDEYVTLTRLYKADNYTEAYETFNTEYDGFVVIIKSIKPARKWWGGKKA
ncbi:hypothetical protein [Listeria booriae]|uniref:hypothetical protein n=1 Tax=Listeria booriae TaxID=1552123 RepID=UPI0016271F60|nr:hypothetical protein [Listeria booriae]MBC1982802.1 hypothetical protein [Listeria booriae]